MSDFEEHRLRTPRTARVLSIGSAGTADEAWFLLHGYAQRADEMLEACRALASSQRLLIAPEALSRFYRRGSSGPIGASWMTREQRDAEIGDYVEYLDRTAGFVERELGCAARTRVALGFSQGAATAWRWAALGTARIERLIAAGGGIPPDLDLSRAASKLSGASLEIVRGSRDGVFTADALARDRERLAADGLACSALEVDSGHDLDPSWLSRL